MIDWTRIDGTAIPTGQATEAGALGATGIGIGTLQDANPGNTVVDLTFDDNVGGATSYIVYVKAGSAPTKASYDQRITGVGSSPYQVTGLSNGTAYYFVYTATDGESESVESNSLNATPNLTPPLTTLCFFGVAA